jgi:uncharacterized protein involved in tellurium resistance
VGSAGGVGPWHDQGRRVVGALGGPFGEHHWIGYVRSKADARPGRGLGRVGLW